MVRFGFRVNREQRRAQQALRRSLDRTIDAEIAARTQRTEHEQTEKPLPSWQTFEQMQRFSERETTWKPDASEDTYLDGQSSAGLVDDPLDEPIPMPSANLTDDADRVAIDIPVTAPAPSSSDEDVHHTANVTAAALLQAPLTTLTDQDVDVLAKQWIAGWVSTVRTQAVTDTVAHVPRRKHIDARETVRQAVKRQGGYVMHFAYRQSPGPARQYTRPLHVVSVCDVSGSMGRYVATVCYLLNAVRNFALVDSYVFSDTPTYATPLLRGATFAQQYVRLQTGATSWEYGTRLSLALQAVREEGRVTRDSTVLLVTDAGFSLQDGDWETTVREIIDLRTRVRRIVVATPNERFANEANRCAQQLWNVERDARSGHAVLTDPIMAKTARYGLLSRYSDIVVTCKQVEDFPTVLAALRG